MPADHGVPLLLVLVVLRPEGNVVHAAGARTASAGFGIHNDVEMIAERVPHGREPQPVSLFRHLAEAKQFERGFGLACIALQHGHPEETADRMLNRNICKARRLQNSGLGMTYKLDLHAVRITERQDGLTHALFLALQGDIFCGKTLFPIGNRRRRNAERGMRHLSGTHSPTRGMRPGKEREDGPGAPGVIAEIKVVSSRIVEVYGLLDETQTQYIGVEVQVTLRVAGYGGHVMQSYDRLGWHMSTPSL